MPHRIQSYTQTTFGDPVLDDQLDLARSGMNFPAATPGANSVALFIFSLDSSAALISQQAGSFTLAVLSFNALADGTSPITISVNGLSDANGNDIQFASENDSVTIGGGMNLPEPEALLLLVSGGLAFRWSQRRIRRA